MKAAGSLKIMRSSFCTTGTYRLESLHEYSPRVVDVCLRESFIKIDIEGELGDLENMII